MSDAICFQLRFVKEKNKEILSTNVFLDFKIFMIYIEYLYMFKVDLLLVIKSKL